MPSSFRDNSRHTVRNQRKVVIRYKEFEREDPLKFDVLVNDCVFIEVKSVESIHPIHKAQLLSYMKLLDVPLGLLIDFNVEKLTDGVSRPFLRVRHDGVNSRCAKPGRSVQ